MVGTAEAAERGVDGEGVDKGSVNPVAPISPELQVGSRSQRRLREVGALREEGVGVGEELEDGANCVRLVPLLVLLQLVHHPHSDDRKPIMQPQFNVRTVSCLTLVYEPLTRS